MVVISFYDFIRKTPKSICLKNCKLIKTILSVSFLFSSTLVVSAGRKNGKQKDWLQNRLQISVLISYNQKS